MVSRWDTKTLGLGYKDARISEAPGPAPCEPNQSADFGRNEQVENPGTHRVLCVEE